MFRDDPFISIVVAVVGGLLAIFTLGVLVDGTVGHVTHFQAEIIDGSFQGSTLHTNTGVAIVPSSSGSVAVAPIISSSGESEHINLVLRSLVDGEVFTIKSKDLELFYNHSKGDVVMVKEFKGVIGMMSPRYTIVEDE